MFVGGGRGDNLGSIIYDLNEKFEKMKATVSLSWGKLSESYKSAAVKKNQLFSICKWIYKAENVSLAL